LNIIFDSLVKSPTFTLCRITKGCEENDIKGLPVFNTIKALGKYCCQEMSKQGVIP